MRCSCRTTSDAASGSSGLLAATVADVSRLRLGLEGSLDLAVAGGGWLTPTVELGMRHDGGDAETGFGVEVGGGSVFADAGRGLRAQMMVRGLVAHEAADFRDWRLSGSLRFDPGPSSELGPAVELMPSWGASSSGGWRGFSGGRRWQVWRPTPRVVSRRRRPTGFGVGRPGNGDPLHGGGELRGPARSAPGLTAEAGAPGRAEAGLRGDAAGEHRR